MQFYKDIEINAAFFYVFSLSSVVVLLNVIVDVYLWIGCKKEDYYYYGNDIWTKLLDSILT